MTYVENTDEENVALTNTSYINFKLYVFGILTTLKVVAFSLFAIETRRLPIDTCQNQSQIREFQTRALK